MYSVFLVEDEIVIRDGLKASFSWEQYGFVFVGDAADGEMALPLIRQTRPDVLITDIRMPFMDGIALSKLVKKELPGTRIIIISGYDDFSYAQEAIHIGVDNYLLKPITKDKLAEVMTDVRNKLDSEQEKDDYYEKFRQESQEYEQYARVRFFNQLVNGALSVTDVYEKSEELGLNLDARRYNLILLDYNLANTTNQAVYSKHMARLSEQLMQYFKCCPEYIVFHWNNNTYAIIIKGDDDTIASHTENCIENISRRCEMFADRVSWYVAQGEVISRFSEFKDSCQSANRKLSCRYIHPEKHIFTNEDVEALDSQNIKETSASVDQHLVALFLENGMESEIDGFLDNLIPGHTDNAIKSVLFCRYFAIKMYLCVCDYLKKINSDPAEVISEGFRAKIENADNTNVLAIIKELFTAAISQRDGAANRQYKNQLALAMDYVDEHYMDPGLNLNEVASEVNISSSYLSAMFSRETETTFVEYVTAKRMEKACRLLTGTGDKTAVIAEHVGYKDPHYFGYIFKKTYGMSPKEYRMKEQQ